MPAVFIHGVPDTAHVWDFLFKQLSRQDLIALELPGFDIDLPVGFASTKEEYVDWIIQELEQMDGPIDLVGHDWGCLLTARVASLRPDLIRSWAAGSGPVSADYVWHPLAQIWQTPEKGEQWMDDLKPDEFTKQLEAYGVPAQIAAKTTKRFDYRMKRSILPLYRSALTVGAEWQPGLGDVKSPGLVFWGKQDEACPVDFADRLAEDTGARRVLKLDCGHWTPIQRPVEVAQALVEHWASV